MTGACGPYYLGGSAIAMGVTTTIPPTPSLRKSERTYRPSSTAQKHTGRSMATTCCTNGWRGQKINARYISTLQGNLLTPNKEEDGHTRGHFFCFSLSSFPYFTFFTTNITRALPLETIKGEAWTHTSLRRTHTSLR
jgi:hypothetical protein